MAENGSKKGPDLTEANITHIPLNDWHILNGLKWN